MHKVSSQISLCRLHRLISDFTFSLNWIFGKKKLPYDVKNCKSPNVIPDKPVGTSQAKLERHLTNMHLTPFSKEEAHFLLMPYLLALLFSEKT